MNILYILMVHATIYATVILNIRYIFCKVLEHYNTFMLN